MTQRLPVARQLYWPGLLPQFGAITLIDLAIFQFTDTDFAVSTLLAAGLYWLACGVMRRFFANDQRLGMRAYRASKFEEAVGHFKNSYDFFTKHPWLDRYRFLLLGTSSVNPYRTISLCNMAFCEAQLGHGNRAIELYEEALKLTPDCAIAQVALRMLRATATG